MGLKVKQLSLVVVLSGLMVFAVVSGAYAYSSVLALGDSLSDNGSSLPYDYSDPYGAVVSTNGAVWVEYLADDLGATLNDMAYSGATTSLDNPALRNYFLSLGDEDTADQLLTSTGLLWQTYAYESAFGLVADDTLITITAGGNDMFNDRDAVVAAGNIAAAIGRMMILGGTDFLVMNLSTSQQSDEYTAWMETFNAALVAQLAGLSQMCPSVNLMLLDMNEFVPEADNFTGTWKYNSCDSPDADPETCTNETFAWYDYVGVHPTTEVHAQIAAYAMDTIASVPEPASVFLLLTGLVSLAGVRRRRK